MSDSQQFRPWFEKYPQWFKEQAGILDSAGFTLDEAVLSRDRRIQFKGHSKVDPERELCVAFPDAFPSAAPKVFDTPSSKLLSRHHRIDTRQLCLFGFNENRWSATLTVANALAEAEELISKFKNGDSVTQDQPPEPITRAIPYAVEAAILVPPPISTFNAFAELNILAGTFRLKFNHDGDLKRETRGRGIVYEASFGAKRLRCPSVFADYLKGGGKDVYGDWFYIKNPPTQDGLHDVVKKCFDKVRGVKKSDYYWLGLLFNEEAGTSGQSRLTWLIVRLSSAGEGHFIRTFPYIQAERAARIPGLEELANKCVTLIGCGSLGSKIAANLAASGVNHFQLVDYDYFEPNNSVRHELGVECFGLNKEKALLSRLCSLNPAVAETSEAFNFQVASISPFAKEEEFFNLLKRSDLLIDATAIRPPKVPSGKAS